MKGKYDVVELSKKVISIANENGIYITNLQLQKIMYYIQGNFMKNYGIKAFDEPIECWPYGPVIKRVWRLFNVFGRNPVRYPESSLVITDSEYKLILDILKEKTQLNIWDLVEETHNELPWKKANSQGKTILSDADMKEFFCR